MTYDQLTATGLKPGGRVALILKTGAKIGPRIFKGRDAGLLRLASPYPKMNKPDFYVDLAEVAVVAPFKENTDA